MPNDAEDLVHLTRAELIAKAGSLGVPTPELLTRAELKDEIVRRSELDEQQRRLARGWFGAARDLVASVVDQGLHLPDAAKFIRGEDLFEGHLKSPVPTVTLAEIYAAQGHVGRSRKMLEEVLLKEPDHHLARELLERLSETSGEDRSSRRAKIGLGSPLEAPATRNSSADVAGESRASTASFGGSPGEDGSHVSDPPASPRDEHAAERPLEVGSELLADPNPTRTPGEEPALNPNEPPAAGDGTNRLEATSSRALAGQPAEPARVPDQHTVDVEGGVPERAEGAAAEPCAALFLFREEEERVFAYWELDGPPAFGREAPELVIRLAIVEPNWEGPICTEREVRAPSARGWLEIPGIPRDGVVRAALGFHPPDGASSEARFQPLAIASELEPDGRRLHWAPPALVRGTDSALERALRSHHARRDLSEQGGAREQAQA